MSKIRLTMAQALVKFLDNQYLCVDGEEIKFVQGIFAIFGHGNVLGLGQALEQSQSSLMVYQGRNEQGMAHAAIAYAKQKLRRQIIACTSSVGPGAANMVTAAATATANRIPLLLLPGDVYATRQPDPVLQQIEQSHDLSISTNDAFRSVSKYWDRITRPEQLMSACISAMRVLTDPSETGAVTLCLPQDVQGEAYDYPDYFFEKRCHYFDRRLPNSAQLEQAIALLHKKKYPLIICGGGVKYSGAEAILLDLVNQYQIPFAETQAGKGAISSDHPFNLGGIGETGALSANLLAKQADLIIGIGTRYTDFTTSSKWLFQHPNVQFININISRFDAYKLDAIQLLGDARATLQLISEQLVPYQPAWQHQIAAAKQQYDDEVKRVYSATFSDAQSFIPEVSDAVAQPALFKEFHALTDSYLTQSMALGIVNRHLPDNAIVVAASGSLPGDLQRVWQARGGNDYHVEYGYSCMGYEVNGALGVKLAEPNREVYAMVGDGAFMMLHSELVTSIQEHKKINVILFDNMTNGCINNLQVGNGMGSYTTEFRFRDQQSQQLNGGLIPVNYAQVAAGYGCRTFQVTTLQQLKQALTEALLSPISTLIDVKVLPKTMVHGYLSWWRVGVAQTSTNPNVNSAAQRLNNNIEKAREY